MREREGGGERERQRQRQTDRQEGGEGERERQRQTDRQTERRLVQMFPNGWTPYGSKEQNFGWKLSGDFPSQSTILDLRASGSEKSTVLFSLSHNIPLKHDGTPSSLASEHRVNGLTDFDFHCMC